MLTNSKDRWMITSRLSKEHNPLLNHKCLHWKNNWKETSKKWKLTIRNRIRRWLMTKFWATFQDSSKPQIWVVRKDSCICKLLTRLINLSLIWNLDCFTNILFNNGINLKTRETKSFSSIREGSSQVLVRLITRDFGRFLIGFIIQSSELILWQVMMLSLVGQLTQRLKRCMTVSWEKSSRLNLLCTKIRKNQIQKRKCSILSKKTSYQVFWKNWLVNCLLTEIWHQKTMISLIPTEVFLRQSKALKILEKA